MDTPKKQNKNEEIKQWALFRVTASAFTLNLDRKCWLKVVRNEPYAYLNRAATEINASGWFFLSGWASEDGENDVWEEGDEGVCNPLSCIN